MLINYRFAYILFPQKYNDFRDRGLLLTRKLLIQVFVMVKLSDHLESLQSQIMTWLTVMEYLCHKWPRICSVFRYHNPILSFYTVYHSTGNKNNTMGIFSEAETAFPSRASEICLVVFVLFNL